MQFLTVEKHIIAAGALPHRLISAVCAKITAVIPLQSRTVLPWHFRTRHVPTPQGNHKAS
jgi:hypothetical protein